MQEPLAVNITEAARRLGISARTVATLVAHKELRSCRIGRRRVITIRALGKVMGYKRICRILGLRHRTVRNVLAGKSWKS